LRATSSTAPRTTTSASHLLPVAASRLTTAAQQELYKEAIACEPKYSPAYKNLVPPRCASRPVSIQRAKRQSGASTRIVGKGKSPNRPIRVVPRKRRACAGRLSQTHEKRLPLRCSTTQEAAVRGADTTGGCDATHNKRDARGSVTQKQKRYGKHNARGRAAPQRRPNNKPVTTHQQRTVRTIDQQKQNHNGNAGNTK